MGELTIAPTLQTSQIDDVTYRVSVLYGIATLHILLGIMICLSLCFQINTNGIISANHSFHYYEPQLFPLQSRYLVAPFWDDVDISRGVGNISYQVYSTGSPLLDIVNTIISDEENINFTGHWMIVAEWDGVPEIGGRPNQVSVNN